MKAAKALAAIAALLALSLAASVPAQARNGGGHGGYHGGGHGGYYHGGHGGYYHHGYSGSYGFYFGWPFYSSWYYPPYYYPYYSGYPYYPGYGGAVVAPGGPTTYVERADEQAAPQARSWWYYCTESKTYYPYVKHCPGGWEKVAPQPPAQ